MSSNKGNELEDDMEKDTYEHEDTARLESPSKSGVGKPAKDQLLQRRKRDRSNGSMDKLKLHIKQPEGGLDEKLKKLCEISSRRAFVKGDKSVSSSSQRMQGSKLESCSYAGNSSCSNSRLRHQSGPAECMSTQSQGAEVLYTRSQSCSRSWESETGPAAMSGCSQSGEESYGPWADDRVPPSRWQQCAEREHYGNHQAGYQQTFNMSLWAKTQLLSESEDARKQIQMVYGQQFPLMVRHNFAQWIEDQPWQNIDENNPEHETFAVQLLENLVQQLETKGNEANLDFVMKLNFIDFAKKFRTMYHGNPMNFVRVVKRCLATEETLIRMAETPSAMGGMEFQGVGHSMMYTNQDVQKQIEHLFMRTEQTDQDLRQMHYKQEQFVIDYQNSLKTNNDLQSMKAQAPTPQRTQVVAEMQAKKDAMDKHLLSAASQMLAQRLDTADKHKETLDGLEKLQKKVVDEELIHWKREQQLAGNGAQFDPSLIETLQKWCEALAELIWKNRQQIIKVDLLRQQLPIEMPTGRTDIQPELNQMVTGLLSSLVTSTFIVENQPPQVLKTQARFTATVRLLVGGKLNLQMCPPKVKATIISEHQARGLLQKEDGKRREKSGEIANDNGMMDFHQHTGVLSITFRNMSLKNIKRADRKGQETVAEEKFCILFSSDFNVGGNELKFQVWTLSLPVVVTVHGNQECQATATFLWDNQFSKSGRVPFKVPDNVPWPEVAKMLSTKFQSMTGRGLSDANLKYLGHKLFNLTGNHDLAQNMVTWTQFNKENLPGRNFTFWEWFWSVGKLVKEQLKGPWCDGIILGFVNKQASQDMLLDKAPGTFIVRFSDTVLGAVTLAWTSVNEATVNNKSVFMATTCKQWLLEGSIIGFIEKNEAQDLLLSRTNGTFLLRFSDGTIGGITIAWVSDSIDKPGVNQVWNLQPYTVKDFSIRGLADRVKDLNSLVTLFPDKGKEEAFQKYYSHPSTENAANNGTSGYVKSTLITVIEAGDRSEMPLTPQPQPFMNPMSPYSDNARSVHDSNSMMDTMMDNDQDNCDMPVAMTDFTHEDLDFTITTLLNSQQSVEPTRNFGIQQT